ncbi:MAG TPA: hypothetical protein VGL97_20815 [Bryobacteraceae bacterium]
MTDYISGGYYVLKTIPRPHGLSDILPNTLLTISTCFTRVVRDIIELQWDSYDNVGATIAEEANEFGIPQARIPELITWAKAQHNTNDIVYSEVAPALELRHRFIGEPSARVVGIGLHASLLDSFESQLEKDINRGSGLLELVREKRPPAEGGAVLGFEPLGFEAMTFHSWLCHYAPDEAFKRFGIRPNQLGLIDGIDDAKRVNDYLLETGAEPAIWEPWLVLDYTAKSDRSC